MRHFVTYPLTSRPAHPDLLTKRGLVGFAQRAEELGFAGIGFTAALSAETEGLRGLV